MGIFLISMFFFMYKVEDLKIRIFSAVLLGLWLFLLRAITKADRKSHFSMLSYLCKWIILLGMLTLPLFQIN